MQAAIFNIKGTFRLNTKSMKGICGTLSINLLLLTKYWLGPQFETYSNAFAMKINEAKHGIEIYIKGVIWCFKGYYLV